MKLPFRSGAVWLMTSLLSLASCSAMYDDTSQEAASITRQSDTALQTHQVTEAPPVTWLGSQWVNPHPLTVSEKTRSVPACSITLVSAVPLTLSAAAQRITASCGLPVTIQPPAGLSANGETRQINGSLPLPDAIGRTPLAKAGAMPSSRLIAVTSPDIGPLSWQGPLGGLLDTLSTRSGMHWRHEGGQITFFSQTTETFQIAVLNASTSMDASVTGGTSASAGVSGGGSNSNSLSGNQDTSQKTTVRLASELYDDLRKAVETMLTPDIGRYYLSTASSTLTVTDTPEVLARVRQYIETENSRLNRQVTLKVEVYSVTAKKANELGLDWKAVYNSVTGIGASLTGSFASGSSTASSAGMSILDSATGRAARWRGSEVFIKALAEQGNLAVVTTQTSTTTNMVPVPVQVADQTVYLASTKTTTSDSYSATELTPGSITTGFNMTMMPYVRDNGDIQLQFSFNLSDSPTIRTVTSSDGNTSIEMPYTKLRSLAQRVNMKSGQTLILSGYESTAAQDTREGTFTPKNWLFGGGRGVSDQRATLVILITPVLS